MFIHGLRCYCPVGLPWNYYYRKHTSDNSDMDLKLANAGKLY